VHPAVDTFALTLYLVIGGNGRNVLAGNTRPSTTITNWTPITATIESAVRGFFTAKRTKIPTIGRIDAIAENRE